MSVILLILKIVGIIIASLIGLFLLLLIVFLLVPLRYKGNAEFQTNPLTGTGWFRISWLLHIISGTGRYHNSEFEFSVKIFGIKIRGTAEEKKVKEAVTEVVEKETKALESGAAKVAVKSNTASSKEVDKKSEAPPDTNSGNGGKKKKRKQGCLLKKTDISKGKKHISNIWAQLTDPVNKYVYHKAVHVLKYLLKHYRPRRVKANLAFSMEDPSYTGYTIAVISMIPAFYKKGVHICPNFSVYEWMADGYISFRGHFRTIHLLNAAIQLLTDKQVRYFYKNMKS